MIRLGMIGAGNMGSAIIRGVLADGLMKPDEIMASASSLTSPHLTELRDSCGIKVTDDNRKTTESAEILVLAVKPNMYEAVIEEISPYTAEEQIIVSIAPGKTLAWLQEKFGQPHKIVRCMPNTPAMVGEGMTGYCVNEQLTEKDKDKTAEILQAIGRAELVKETQMDAVVAVSGSSPAYVFMLIEAMADAAVAEGMQRSQAYTFAAQAVLGSAKLVLESGRHPGELKDMVCSPGGTTIDAVCTLEGKGFRSAVEAAMKVCAEKSGRM